MELGLKRNEVKLVRHDPSWKQAFNEVRESLACHTKLNREQIEHIGSTAVEGIKAKPIIDILVGIDSLDSDISKLQDQLKQCGFYRLKVERPEEIVFARFTDATFGTKTHFIHLVEYKGNLWSDLIYFRDYLSTHSEAKEEYESIKTAFVNEKSEGIVEYTDHKESFVRKVQETRE
ncbi:GrpB family protein [Alkalibacterium pelagium]|uniref:GrpB domain, predicted nucleotidyltransferase, UPF0157 family n=1 Tax=Alkalibacterium pelagium TaxID=426702 RepID=A0A1H7JDY2_9LACT|nr:GrpB family protein [Alkalibacterium pelagium]GEN50191.1 hypothetical protein APE02nite_08560 [Alkalibacterium pelagium]SEK72097.1 GrpB domain, predicted nucleotidyltransferase, UPF0157 family [Alkalibacterium pelagium]